MPDQIKNVVSHAQEVAAASHVTIVVNAEDKFGVKIPDEEVKNLKTVGDAVNFIVSAS